MAAVTVRSSQPATTAQAPSRSCLLATPEDSSQLESYGLPGPGRYVTIYTNAGHAWMTIAGRRFDTIAYQETGTRWSDTMASADGYVVVHPAGF